MMEFLPPALLRMGDISRYVASRRREEVIGISNHPYYNLISQAVKWKHHVPYFCYVSAAHGRLYWYDRSHTEGVCYHLPPDLYDCLSLFTDLAGAGLQLPITRDRWEKATLTYYAQKRSILQLCPPKARGQLRSLYA